MKVSLIIPCYNEENTIQDLLAAICEQNFPLADIDVVISDGMSTDTTRAITAIDWLTAYSRCHGTMVMRIS